MSRKNEDHDAASLRKLALEVHEYSQELMDRVFKLQEVGAVEGRTISIDCLAPLRFAISQRRKFLGKFDVKLDEFRQHQGS